MHALADYIRVYDEALTADFCDRLIAGFEQASAMQKRNGRGVREGLELSAWTELNIGAMADQAFLCLTNPTTLHRKLSTWAMHGCK